MSRKPRRQVPAAARAASVDAAALQPRRKAPLWLLLPAAAVLLFYAVPLLSPNAGIQWDAADVHYCAQRYLSEEILAGRLPLWTPFLYSGFPFLADPQAGAFYPFNWPFLLAGAGPRLIQAEISLHSLLAVLGMLMLLRLHVSEASAAFGAVAYGLSGFFAGHASHVGMVQAAGLLPWLLYCAEMAFRRPFFRWLGAAGIVAGMMFLAGHFQTALYGCGALALYAAARTAGERRLLGWALALLGGTALLAFLISAPMTLPGLELARESIRSGQDYSSSKEGVLELRALATLIVPDALGALREDYRGPGDRTQYYFYAGILLVPLAAAGLVSKRGVRIPAAMAIVSIWFMFGPDAGLYRLGALIPFVRQLRAPVHAWFVAALALAWLSALGLERAASRFPAKWTGWGAFLLLALDLCLMNSWGNPLAYMRRSFEEAYERGIGLLENRIGPALPAGMRFAAPDGVYAFGPLNGPLVARVETTYGYNPLQLRRYAEYRQAAASNPRLLDALGAALWLDPGTGQILSRQTALPKAWFPAEVKSLPTASHAAALNTLDPARQAIADGDAAPAVDGQILSIDAGRTEWRIRYRAARGGLMALSLPWYPGWQGTVEGRTLPLLRINHALTGVMVPEGDHDLLLRFQSRHLGLGVLLSLCGSLLAVALWLSGRTPAARSPSQGTGQSA